MGSIERNRQIVAEAGYVDSDWFVLPIQDWHNYYGPGEQRVGELREKYAGDREVLATLNEVAREYDLFRAYHDAYGYVFYVMRKRGA